MWVKGEIFGKLEDASRLGRAILTDQHVPSPFGRFDWFERVARFCPPIGMPLIARARANSGDCWLFLAEQPGGHAVSYTCWYSLRFAPSFVDAENERQREAMLVALIRRLPKRIVSVSLSPMHQQDADCMASAFGRAGWRTTLTATSASWTANVTDMRFADYWAARPGELRSTVKRKRAKAGMEITIDHDFVPAHWEEYESIYADSWKDEEGSMPFLRDMAEHEAAAGRLRLGIGRIDGVAVAAQLWTVDSGTAYIHKLAHRESHAELSPGSILSAAMFEHVIDGDKVDIIDFGTGDDRYKRDWMDARAPLLTFDAYNMATASGALRAGKAGLGQLVRRLRSR